MIQLPTIHFLKLILGKVFIFNYGFPLIFKCQMDVSNPI